MTWFNDPAKNRAFQQGESVKIRWEVIGYCQGEGLDIGCGDHKIFRHAIGIDRRGRGANLAGNVERLKLVGDDCMDFVFSSHCLEDIADHEAALADWWRVLKVGGHLVLYLPHKAHYPNVGQPHANQAHKHDFEPEDIVKAMQKVAPDWALVENQDRDEDDEYSFLQVYRKRAPGSGQGAALQVIDPAKRCIVMRYGGYGDVLVAASTFPHLKAEGWHITVYTGDKGAEILRHDPNVDRVVIHDVLAMKNGELRELTDYLRASCDRFISFSHTFEGLFLANPANSSFWWSHDMRHRYMNGNYLEAAHQVAGVPQVYQQNFHSTVTERDEATAWRRGRGIQQLVAIAVSGTGVNKVWPGQFEYAWRLVDRNPDLHVVTLGETYGAKFFEHERIHQVGTTWPVRRALAMAQLADLVIGPETGMLNAVAHEVMPKIVLLSHSSAENLTRHWTRTEILAGDVPCYPCHRLHKDWSGCNKDAETGQAACQAAIPVMSAIELTERLLGIQHRAAA